MLTQAEFAEIKAKLDKEKQYIALVDNNDLVIDSLHKNDPQDLALVKKENVLFILLKYIQREKTI